MFVFSIFLICATVGRVAAVAMEDLCCNKMLDNGGGKLDLSTQSKAGQKRSKSVLIRK